MASLFVLCFDIRLYVTACIGLISGAWLSLIHVWGWFGFDIALVCSY